MASDWRWEKSAGVMNFGGRDIIIVRLSNNRAQPFYRSTGENSHFKGRWFPFDGLMSDGWFDKRRFVQDKYGNGDSLHRYGTEEMREISNGLALLDIPAGEEMEYSYDSIVAVNEWIIKERKKR